MSERLCLHCNKPINHTARKGVLYCNRLDCLQERANQRVEKHTRVNGKKNIRCSICGRTMKVLRTEKNMVCSQCRDYLGIPEGPIDINKLDEKLVCESCGDRVKAYWLGFRKMCVDCWHNDGPKEPDITQSGVKSWGR